MQTEYKQMRVGLAGLGLAAYWPQFSGLEQRLLGYLDLLAARIARPTRSVVNLRLIDDGTSALAAAHRCRREDIDLLLVYSTTYALSSTVLPLIQRARVPVILLNLQPAPALDYARINSMSDRREMTGEWLAHCGSCPIPEIANVLCRLDLPFEQVTGMLFDDAAAEQQLEQWLLAAEAVYALAHSRLGLMGHLYNGMLDVSTDLVQVSGRFGLQLEVLEVDDLSALRRSLSREAVADKLAAFEDFFSLEDACASAELERAARTAAALDLLVERSQLDLLAYYYRGSGVAENEDVMSSIILGTSMLTGRGVPVAGEYEIKNVLAMKILDLLGRGGSFTEYYAMDYTDDTVLMGHDGPGHIGIAEGKIKVRPLAVYHGKVGSGLSVEMSVRHGPVTLLSVVEDRAHGFKFVMAEGECVPGETLKIGNTNSRFRFRLGARGFAESWNAQGPAHHCAIGLGHVAGQLKKVASLLRLPALQVC